MTHALKAHFKREAARLEQGPVPRTHAAGARVTWTKLALAKAIKAGMDVDRVAKAIKAGVSLTLFDLDTITTIIRELSVDTIRKYL